MSAKKGKPAPDCRRPFPIACVGASAGGIEALARFLSRLPARTGMGFVVVQHLAPERESLLPQILQKSTTMPVVQAKGGARVLPDHVYVIPPGEVMEISGGRLRLTPRAGRSLPVDSFLNSLASDQRRQAVAVILSGSASDGALGVKAVKAAGGIVFAQDEVSAGHVGMPHSAVGTGAVDLVLPPEEIAAELARLALNPYMARGLGAQGPKPADQKALERIFDLLRRQTRVDFTLYKPTTVWRRLMRRVILHRLQGLDQYAEKLGRDPAEVRALHDEMLIHVTHFFREPEVFDLLRAKVFPRLLKAKAPGKPVRVWVPGCSTGEEAYSLAICLLEFLGDRPAGDGLQVFATDVSEPAVERARAGVYGGGAANDVPPRLLKRYFSKADGGYQVSKRVREACVFAKHDLTKDPPFAGLDLISCRNVLIYMGATLQRRIMPMFHYALKPSGALLLGNAETVGSFTHLFGVADKKHRLYFKKPGPSGAHLSLAPRAQAPFAGHEKAGRTEPAGEWPETDIQRVADRVLLSRFAPAGVVVNADMDILQFRGRVSRFLEPAPGKASLNLLRMLPDAFGLEVRALLHRAGKQDSPAKERGLDLPGDGRRARPVAIEVLPFRVPLSQERLFLDLFEEEPPLPKAAPRASSRQAADAHKRLRQELASTKRYLQTIVEEHEAANEELKAANEEIIAANEELQSTNEELETAKEELQAANEELTTLNEELQHRNADLNALNSDLVNLLASVHLPIVMLGTDLRIRRFTPMAERIMNLIPGDVGRPIGDIKPKVELPNIEQLVHDVIDTMSVKQLEVRDKDGRWFSLRVRPYRTLDNKIDGAVIVLVDIDPARRGLMELMENPLFAEALLDLVRQPLLILDPRLRVLTASRSLYQAFGETQAAAGRPVFELQAGRWDFPELRAALERLAEGGPPFEGLRGRDGGSGLSFSARRATMGEENAPLILLTVDKPAPAR